MLIADLSNLGLVAGAVASSAAWQFSDVQAGLGTSLVFIGLAFAALGIVRTGGPPQGERPKVLAPA